MNITQEMKLTYDPTIDPMADNKLGESIEKLARKLDPNSHGQLIIDWSDCHGDVTFDADTAFVSLAIHHDRMVKDPFDNSWYTGMSRNRSLNMGPFSEFEYHSKFDWKYYTEKCNQVQSEASFFGI